MKERELERLGNCVVCGKPLFDREKAGLTFYRIQVTRLGANLGAIERRMGLGMMLGSPAVAQAMGPDEDLAIQLGETSDVLVHEECAGRIHHVLELRPESEPAEPQS